jgi:hypothetical protein
MTNLTTWKDGQIVTGEYCGVSYRGAINSSASRRTPDGRNFIFAINLQFPIHVYGQPRFSIEIWDNSTDTLRAD